MPLSTARTPLAQTSRLIALAGAIALAYAVLAVLGRQAGISDAGVSLFWPPTAFGIAVVARTRGWALVAGTSGLFLGVLCVDFFYFGFVAHLALLFAIVNVVEQFAIGTVLKYFGAQRLVALKDLLVLIVAAVVVIGFTSLVGGALSVAQFGGTYTAGWRTWLAGGLSAAIIAGPFFLTLLIPKRLRLRSVLFALPVVALLLVTVLWKPPSPYLTVLLAAAVIAPALVWLGLRFGVMQASGVATLITYLAAVAPTESGGLLNPISGDVSLILSTQLVVVLFCSLIYAAAIVEQARKAAILAERVANAELIKMFNASPIPICLVITEAERPGRIEIANEAFASMVGVDLSQLKHRDFGELFGPAHVAAAFTNESQLDGSQHVGGHEGFQFVRSDGRAVWVRLTVARSASEQLEGKDSYVVFAQDETHRHDLEVQQQFQATHDALTGLLNRYALVEAIDQHLARTAPEGPRFCVLLCDVDDFKEINDSLGHTAGDRVLQVVAGRLLTLTEQFHVISRFGGDEFVLICEGTVSDAEALALATRVQAALAGEIVVSDSSQHVRVSVGIAFGDSTVSSASDLLSRADLAMYAAKMAGRDRAEIYTPMMQQRLQQHIEINAELRDALAEDRIVCWFQPVVEPTQGRAVGAEALVRLKRRDGSLLLPKDFIEIAESSGPIIELGERVLNLALSWLASQADDELLTRVAVNVSVKQLNHSGFFDTVMQALQAYELVPDRLVIEVTERVLMEDHGVANSTLGELRAAGVHVAIDDFGTGYSSLNALKWMPADIVKIDRTFTMNMIDSADDYAIVEAVIQVSHTLGRTVVGEGVETKAQAAAMARLGCDHIQGYFYAKPQPPEHYVQVQAEGIVVPGSN